MAEVEEIEVEEQTVAESPKRPRGRPPKDGASAKVKTISDVPNPPFTKYYSDHRNPPQRTTAAWAWWNKLPVPAKEIIEAHVYRDWPVLLDPPEGEYKYIDVIIGTDPIQNDQDFIDKYGAGKYHVYLNANPAATGSRRTLYTAFIDGSHDTTKYPPCDKRIQNIDNISLTDPANAAFVAALRASGKLKDDAKDAREKEEMSATAEVLGKVLDQNTAVMNRILDEKDKQIAESESVIPPEPPPSPQEVISEQLNIFKSLKELVPTADPLEMVKQVIGMAQVLTQKDGNANADLKPLMDEISKLREESRATEREFFRTQLADIKEQLRAAKETPPPSNVLLPDGSNLDAIVKKAVEKAVENGLGGEADNSWWIEPAKQLLPIALPLLGSVLQRFMMPSPPMQAAPPFPMPPGTAMQQQPQAQLPAPAPMPQQPAQQVQPQQTGGAYTTGNPQLDMLLMMIQVPLADHLRDNATGGEFAEYFIDTYGLDIHTQLASSGVDPIVTILYSYPPLGPILKPLAREQVVKFISDFVAYKPSAEPPAGGAA